MLFLRKAEESEAKALRRGQQIMAQQRAVLNQRWRSQKKFWEDRDFEIELDAMVSKARTQDPVWKGHVSDNQWYISKATMYGVAAQNERLGQLIELMRDGRQAL